jgi:uncharacterized membrane protein YraQ (UPF0718 family)
MTEMTATSPLRVGLLAVYSRQIVSRLSHIDFVLFALAVLFGGLYLYSPDQAFRTVRYVAGELAEIAPWLAGSVMIAAFAKATGADLLAARAFRGRQSGMVVTASLIGALLPFCSCGVIPLVAGLLGAGVPLAPVMAFWISSPLMDPAQFLIAAGALGTDFAVAKMISAIGMGMLAGFGTMLLIRVGWLDAPAALRITPNAAIGGCKSKVAALTTEAPKSCCGSTTAAPIAEAPKSCCGSSAARAVSSGCGSKATATRAVIWRFWTDATRSQRFLTTATTTGWFLVRWLAVAYALESLMIAWLPVGAVGTWLGAGSGLLAVPLAVAIGIPIYLNSFAAIPFVSGLIGLGMSPATGMAFMLATSATGFPAMVAVWALVKPRAFALYLGFAITGAVIAGYTYAAALALGAGQ